MIRFETNYKRNIDLLNYNEKTWHSLTILWRTLANAHATLRDTYLLNNIDEYFIQLQSDKNEDKKDIFWNVGRRKLLDAVVISIAFENINKVKLIKEGYLIHKIKPTFSKVLSKKQREGIPIKVEDFFKDNYTIINPFTKEVRLNGLYDNLSTINYSHTLNENFQKIIGYKKEFVWELKKLNKERNRLHFFTGNKGGFENRSHMRRWSFIKNESFSIITRELHKIEKELKEFD